MRAQSQSTLFGALIIIIANHHSGRSVWDLLELNQYVTCKPTAFAGDGEVCCKTIFSECVNAHLALYYECKQGSRNV